MINILIVSHCSLAKELIATAETVAGKQNNLFCIEKSIKEENLQSLQNKIEETLTKISTPEGTLILTDMLGGSPCNASLLTIKKYNVEILTGVNLPMVLSAVFASKTSANVKDLADNVLASAQKGVVNAKKMMLEKLKV